MLSVSRRKLMGLAAGSSLLLPAGVISGATAEPSFSLRKLPISGVGGARPAAISDRNWARKASWDFGTAAGNNITQLSDLIAAGWHMDANPKFLNNEIETYNGDNLTNGNKNFQPQSNHCDLLAIYTGGTPAGGNGSITSLSVYYNTDKLGLRTAIGYYEGTFRIGNVTGQWPAWWMVGHAPQTGDGQATWGPEIDIFEFLGAHPTDFTASLHGSINTIASKCFTAAGGAPAGAASDRHCAYRTNGVGKWNMGGLEIANFADFSRAFHRFGCLIDTNHNISIWIDDAKMGTFFAQQYCDDKGSPVVPHLIMNLAVGGDGGPVNYPADFGGVDYAGPNNKFRLGVKNIQVWAP